MMNHSLYKLALIAFLAGAIVGCQETHEASEPEARQVPRKLALPDNAKVVAEGAGDLKFRAPQDGRVFVFDVEDSTVLNARHVRAGQIVEIKPGANVVMLDGHKVTGQELKKDHTHRLLFEPE
jgi:hypothetical protein